MMRWGVWETSACDGLVAHGHDDLLVRAALVAVLDKQEWPGTGESGIVERRKCWRSLIEGSGARPPRECVEVAFANRLTTKRVRPSVRQFHLSSY